MKTKTKNILVLLNHYAPDKYLKRGLLQKIGLEASASRELVRVTAKNNDFISSRDRTNKYNHYIPCKQCGKVFRATKYLKVFCTRKCFNEWREENCWAKLKCYQCKKIFKRSKSQYKQSQKMGQTMFFCTKKCQGKWLGLTYGKGKQEKK